MQLGKLLKPLNILISPLALKPLFLQEFSAVGDFSPLESHCSSQSIVMKYRTFFTEHTTETTTISAAFIVSNYLIHSQLALIRLA